MFQIPVYQPTLGNRESQNVLDCIASTWISSKGKYIAQFESAFATYVGARHAASVCNGTVALHLALVALGVGAGDEVIVPTLTYIASANAIKYTGATPVFADSDPRTWQLAVDDVRRKLTARTRAIMAVHLYGHPCDLAALRELARSSGIFLVEDCAEAIGTRYRGAHVGLYGDISTFSFFGNKTITTGEGGMVVTNDETLHTRVCHYKGQGLAAHREYWHDVVGYNYRMTNICAALGVAQLERVEEFVTRKRQIARKYIDNLRDSDLEFHEESAEAFHSYWMFSILVADPAQRDPLRQFLAKRGIETRPVFNPVHTMPMYSERFQRLRVAEDLGWRGINLPSWPGLSDAQVDYISECVRQGLKQGVGD